MVERYIFIVNRVYRTAMIENKGIKLPDQRKRGIIGNGQLRITRIRTDIIEIEKKQDRQKKRPKKHGHHNPTNPLTIECAHWLARWQKEHTRHHDEKWHARTYHTAREDPCQESLPIHIKMGYHPITTMREYDQKTGQDPQGIDPTNILPRQYTHK